MNKWPIVHYRPHRVVLEIPRGPEHRRIYMFVTQPIVMPFPFECPTKTVVDLDGEILNKILLPLRDDQQLVECIAVISKKLVYQPKYLTGFVLGIRCMSFALTEVGRQYAAENFNTTTITLEELKELVRPI